MKGIDRKKTNAIFIPILAKTNATVIIMTMKQTISKLLVTNLVRGDISAV